MEESEDLDNQIRKGNEELEEKRREQQWKYKQAIILKVENK
jgi:hypothetical protein